MRASGSRGRSLPVPSSGKKAPASRTGVGFARPPHAHGLGVGGMDPSRSRHGDLAIGIQGKSVANPLIGSYLAPVTRHGPARRWKIARLRRSELSIPGSNPRMLERAPDVGADVVMLDLEDAVAPDTKEEARRNIIEALCGL